MSETHRCAIGAALWQAIDEAIATYRGNWELTRDHNRDGIRKSVTAWFYHKHGGRGEPCKECGG
jgi:hypothetical protein